MIDWNKLLGVILVSILIVILVDITASGIYPYSFAPKKRGYQVEVETGIAKKEEVILPLFQRFALANIENGERLFKIKCASCHISIQGAKSKITAPNLWRILGRKKGMLNDFAYSPAMLKKGGIWGYNEIDIFLTKPKAYIKKTKMSFNGIKNHQQRADVIAYLRSRGSKSYPALKK